MRLTIPKRGPFPWLASLKSAQLQCVARATGIQSSGTNGVLVERIQSTLSPYLQGQEPKGKIPHNGTVNGDQAMSILSIDMGIQNLAFAHLRVPSASDSKSTPELTAWRRLAMSEIASLDLRSGAAEAVVQSSTSPMEKNAKEAKKEKEKEIFSPPLYATNAYTLVTKLLSTYNPTHILIERQRFRSAGGSAVQEWTLRVGVMEGMLYAVLHALRQERGGDVSKIQVDGIEPKRVVQYWIDRERGGEKMSAREVKRAKIEIVGGWLGPGHGGKIGIPEEGVVRDLVDAYLGKVNKEGGRGGKRIEVGKLDDLADCLLQGVTWLEWEAMRARLAREGYGVLEC
ncbi:uncharacterized protein N7498_009984 [Penicillium cinerascens]|uniref:SAP domain-containing protein n=1 Tax=Penicillium cinerascens TaxID=70096 RepID=A0A9W9J748_9EURO|nr:uncharacterized protein N7498_009984 [Penicillium cinerascens]KAJ5190999.1 hypothetical protein N7498_009984 [Penicillium cinerascens]